MWDDVMPSGVVAWEYRTRWGRFRILARKGRYLAMWEEENLGSYHRPRAALDDLVGGHTFFPSSGIDPGECGLPDDFGEWTPIRDHR